MKVMRTEKHNISRGSPLWIACDELPTKENYNKDRRIHRGLFKSNKGKLINADLNGAYQIIRKVFPNVKADGIVGLDLTPVMINL